MPFTGTCQYLHLTTTRDRSIRLPTTEVPNHNYRMVSAEAEKSLKSQTRHGVIRRYNTQANMSWSLVIFLGTGSAQNLHWISRKPALDQHKTRNKSLLTVSKVTCFILLVLLVSRKKSGRIWKKNKVNGPGTSELGRRRISWQWEKHAWLYSDLLQGLNGERLTAVGFQQERARQGVGWTFMSASVVPHFTVCLSRGHLILQRPTADGRLQTTSSQRLHQKMPQLLSGDYLSLPAMTPLCRIRSDTGSHRLPAAAGCINTLHKHKLQPQHTIIRILKRQAERSCSCKMY